MTTNKHHNQSKSQPHSHNIHIESKRNQRGTSRQTMISVHQHDRHPNIIINAPYKLFYTTIFALSAIISPPMMATADVCTVCSNPDHVMNDLTARIVWPPGNSERVGFSCEEIGDLLTGGNFTDCANVQTVSDDICMCGPDDPSQFTCQLCGNGTPLPEPNRVVAGKTCFGWQYYASFHASTIDCPYYQTSMAAYCGCDISDPEFFDDFCRLCGDTLLPDFNQKVTFVDGSQEYCAKVEVEVNVLSMVSNIDWSCEAQQNKYEKACKCDSNQGLPTMGPSAVPDSSANRVVLSQILQMISLFVPIPILWWL